MEMSLQNIIFLTESPWDASRMYHYVKPGHEDEEVPPLGRDLVATGQLPSPTRTRGSTGVLEKPSSSRRGQRVKAVCSSTRCPGPTRGRKPSREQGGITATRRPSKGAARRLCQALLRSSTNPTATDVHLTSDKALTWQGIHVQTV